MNASLIKKILLAILKIPVCILCLVSVVPFFANLLLTENTTEPEIMEDVALMDTFDAYVDEVMRDAETGARSVRKRFWIRDDAQQIPKRDDTKYGEAATAAELQWLIDEAAPLMEGQEMLFDTDIEIRDGTKITYYLDESILAVTWQQVIDRIIYTIAEVKISDPSQFRRYLVDGYYVSHRLFPTTGLSEQAGAVIACSGDHFRGRKMGIVIYDGEIKRYTGEYSVDTCLVDDQGNLNLIPRGTFLKKAELESYIQENNIRFSLSFGPIMIQDGVRCDPDLYLLGETKEGYPRCAICQKDELHYLLITVNGGNRNYNYPTIAMLTDQIEKFDVQQAYCLDGGQTGAIAMQDRLMNPNEYKNGQRAIGDIIFFATAVPDKKS